MQQNVGFKLNNRVLFEKIEAIKKNPPPDILEYKAAHPEFKTVNCSLLAEYIGISEKTLTNLKLGKLPDGNCSTVWMICMALDIDMREYLGLPRKTECDPAACTSHTQARLDEKRQRIAELEALYRDADKHLAAMHSVITAQSAELGAAKAGAAGAERLLAEKDACINRRNRGIRMRNRLIFILAAVLIALLIADLLVADAGWIRFGLLK